MIIAPTQKRRPEGRRFALREALRRTKQLMRINHRLPRHARIELAIPSRRIIQANYLSPDNVRNMNTVHMIACISWRLYFITGVCPVWKLCELAQPKPKRTLRLHIFAAAATASMAQRQCATILSTSRQP
jgi:hypothetical protein